VTTRQEEFLACGFSFPTVDEACAHAREQCVNGGRDSVAIFDNRRMVYVALVSDDANGITIHRLATWPR
jgi:hypothetical protein